MGDYKGISQDIIEKGKELILEGNSISQTAKLLNIDRHTLSNRLKKDNFKYDGFKKSNFKINDDKIINIWNEWKNSNLSLTKYCDKFKYSMKTLSYRFKLLNLEIGNENNKMNGINENFFDTFTEESSYWLGFLLADGYNDCINNFNIELSLKDKEHVEKFKKSLNSNHKISKRIIKSNNAIIYRITISNKVLSLKLEQLGVVSRKTYKPLIVNNLIPDNMIRHFIRGYFEADGSIIKNNSSSKNNIKGASFYSYDIESLNILIDIILKYLPSISINKYYNYDYRCPYFVISGIESSNEFLHWIYHNSNIYLDRKYKLYNENTAV